MRGIIKFLLTLILGIALIWLGFWWYAESRLQKGFTDWADNQAAHGWKISYDSVHRGTSILDAALTIDNLSMTAPPGPAGTQPSLALPRVTLRIAALDPLVFHTDLPNKIAVSFGDNIALVFSTGSIALSENLDPNTIFKRSAYPFRGGDFNAGNIDVLASNGSLLVLHIDQISSHADLNLRAGPHQTAILSRASMDGVAISPLLARLASVPFDGKLAHLDFAANLSGPVPANLSDLVNRLNASSHDLRTQQKLLVPVIHLWASQGGTGSLQADATLGPSTIHADGSVKFDARQQPNGTADLAADHLDQFTQALTNSYPSLQDDIAQEEAELSQYLSNANQSGQTLTLHVTYGPPGIIINGQKRAEMPPLDWNALENPLPPPASVPPPTPMPGDGSGATSPAPATP